MQDTIVKVDSGIIQIGPDYQGTPDLLLMSIRGRRGGWTGWACFSPEQALELGTVLKAKANEALKERAERR